MDPKRLTDLTIQYLNHELSPEGAAELNEWLDKDPSNRERFGKRTSEENIIRSYIASEEARAAKPAMLEEMPWVKEKERTGLLRLIKLFAFKAAAVVIVGCGILVYWWSRSHSNENMPKTPTVASSTDVAPGTDRATLTLGNGKVVVLDETGNGKIADQGGSTVSKHDSGSLVYQNAANIDEPVQYNKIVTPAGGKFTISLPDGTVVYLNAMSSVRFPTVFTGKAREVWMTGEAYFEVAKNAGRQFMVHVGDATITDIGTEFNVMAYGDEPELQATLVEGAAAVSNPATRVLLKPGLQATIGKEIQVNKVPVETVIAWKEGYFEFDNADIKTVMRALARWYNIQINYEGDVGAVRASFSLSRVNKLSVLLKVLAAGGLHFTMDKNTITVKP